MQILSWTARMVEHRTSNPRAVGSSRGLGGSNSLKQDQNGEVTKDLLAKNRYLAHNQPNAVKILKD